VKKLFVMPLVFLLLVSFHPQEAFAHGVIITHEIKETVAITACYDSGEPMSGAQVSIFTPDHQASPWITGVCDQEGRYQFNLDRSYPGTWDIQVRKAGHGEMIHIDVGEAITAANKGVSWTQKILMAGCVVWGLIGTALYFRRRKS